VVPSAGYGRVSAHWRVLLADGRTVFVKHALTNDARAWLRTERLVYESVEGAFIPAFLGFHDDGTTLLVLEDLSAADWPPPWSASRVDAVLAALGELHATRAPDGIEPLTAKREAVTGWDRVATDPDPWLGTAVCSRAWLDDALPVLQRAAAEAKLDGDELIHFDVRSDNLCFVGERAVLVDWNLASKGNGDFDVAFWLPSLRLEGGPEPWEVLADAGPLAAAVAGFFASRAGLPPPAGAPTVRKFQRAQATIALPWAARELGLPRPIQEGLAK
jgi:aminoglycoside phosphotransferase (APT) family kinase protein